jgi:alpha-tubulin suppressor-like RCC1 family protein
VGTSHACDLASGGIAWCWGLNGNEGRIGMAALGVNVSNATPVMVPGNHRFVQLSTYQRHTCGIKADGAAYCWGYNGIGQLGAPVGSSSATPVAVTGGIAFKQIAAGGDHTCGLDFSGKAYCWGQNGAGQLGDGTFTIRNAPVAVTGGLLFSHISAGTSTTCAVAVDGALYCWGQNGLGMLGAGGSSGGFVTAPGRVVGGLTASRVKVAHGNVCAITAGGLGYCWGAVGVTGATLQTTTPVQMAGGLAYGWLSQGAGHGCGVTTGNEIYCWGANALGQLGMTGTSVLRPTLGGGGLGALEVEVGFGTHTCSISTDRMTVYCWGQNADGQLGNGAYTASSVANPTPSIVVGQKPLPRS